MTLDGPDPSGAKFPLDSDLTSASKIGEEESWLLESQSVDTKRRSFAELSGVANQRIPRLWRARSADHSAARPRWARTRRRIADAARSAGGQARSAGSSHICDSPGRKGGGSRPPAGRRDSNQNHRGNENAKRCRMDDEVLQRRGAGEDRRARQDLVAG